MVQTGGRTVGVEVVMLRGVPGWRGGCFEVEIDARSSSGKRQLDVMVRVDCWRVSADGNRWLESAGTTSEIG
jgi:hypothetical protein